MIWAALDPTETQLETKTIEHSQTSMTAKYPSTRAAPYPAALPALTGITPAANIAGFVAH